MSRLFDSVVVVDWSARATPSPRRPSPDAIWIGSAGEGAEPPRYLATRRAAERHLAGRIAAALSAGQRLLVGFDFPFGYPAGFAAAVTGRGEAPALWARLAAMVEDDEANANNRFEVAAALNRLLPGEGPFWGLPRDMALPGLEARKPVRWDAGLAEFRRTERAAPGAKSAWQLAGAGSVGGQALLGIPLLHRLRDAPGRAGGIAAWPFDGGLAVPDAPVVLAEVYPSLLAAEIAAATPAGGIRDEAQVRVTAAALAALDGAGGLAPLFAAPAGLAPDALAAVAREEAWILGAGHVAALRGALADDAGPGAPARRARPPIPAGDAGARAPAGDDRPRAPAGDDRPRAPAGDDRPRAPAGDAPPLRDDCFALPPGIAWVPVDETLARLRAALAPVAGRETVPLGAAAGRILAEPVRSRRANPPVANAAVDGYAFARGGLGEGPQALPRLEGRAAAGRPLGRAVPAGAAVRILTGAPVPEGADTVVLEEDTAADAACVRFARAPKAGANTRPAGEDVPEGAEILPAGRLLRPQDLALAAATGLAALPVRRPLAVAVLSTGDELAAPGAPAAPHQVYDANRPMLLALLARWGLRTIDLGCAPDDEPAVAAALDRGALEADAILATGGASAGDEDHVSRLIRTRGRLDTWRIAVKPGRPLALGFWQERPVFGLPGNPVAAFVTALIFARPALLALAGAPWPEPQPFLVPAAFAKKKKAGRREYLRARRTAEGAAEVFRSEGSGRISGLVWADGLVELPDAATSIAPGDPVRYYPFSEFGL